MFLLSSRYPTLAVEFVEPGGPWEVSYAHCLHSRRYSARRSAHAVVSALPKGRWMNVPSQHIVKNRILRQLSADELKSLHPRLTPVQLQPNAVLLEQGGTIDHIYFPLSGMVSLLVVMQTGEASKPASSAPRACSEATPPSTAIYRRRRRFKWTAPP